MQNTSPLLQLLSLTLLLGISVGDPATAAEVSTSSFGDVVLPSPARPATADTCVEPVEVMRRDHMKFLLHQRDKTVLEGERSKKYSLVGCIDCHNPTDPGGKIVRYEDPEHFCASCHNFTSVKIDCFECHADRELSSSQQGRLIVPTGQQLLSMHTFRQIREQARVD